MRDLAFRQWPELMPPYPKPADQRRRRNAAPAHVTLPAAGRPGPPPTWPLPKQTPREKTLWRRLWATPQATQWERQRCEEVVARYARLLTLAETPSAARGVGVLLAEARQLEDRLGLNPLSMLRLRWDIADEPEVEVPEARPARQLRAVDLSPGGGRPAKPRIRT
ncbi:MAG: hypothetical protein ACRD0S_01495 [Acidimicrobiales bacterium]